MLQVALKHAEFARVLNEKIPLINSTKERCISDLLIIEILIEMERIPESIVQMKELEKKIVSL